MPTIDFAALMREEKARIRQRAAHTSGIAHRTVTPRQFTGTSIPPPAWSYRLPNRPRPTPAVVDSTPQTVQHVRDFVSAEEEAAIIACIDATPPQTWVGRDVPTLD